MSEKLKKLVNDQIEELKHARKYNQTLPLVYMKLLGQLHSIILELSEKHE